jgi:hypothetical protein
LPFPSHSFQLLLALIDRPSDSVEDKVPNNRFGYSVSGVVLGQQPRHKDLPLPFIPEYNQEIPFIREVKFQPDHQLATMFSWWDLRNVTEEEHPLVTLYNFIIRPPPTLLIQRIKLDKCSRWDRQDIFRCIFGIDNLSVGSLDESVNEV